VSHVSAAVLHGLPLWAVPLDRVHVTKSRRSGGRTGSRVRVHTASLDAGDVGLVTGLPVTSLARTVADLARTLPFPQAVALADGAMFVKR
jgi:predicted transcriptional regulator of viral defense system